MKTLPLFSILATLVILPSCVPLEVAAPPVQQLGTHAANPAISRGRSLYIGECTKCHSANPIREHSQTEWNEEILPPMCKKSKLSPAEKSDLEQYISAVLVTPPAPKA